MRRKIRTITKAEHEFDLAIRKNENRAQIISHIIRYGTIGVVMVYAIHVFGESVAALAGKQTNADIGIKIYASVGKWMAYLVAVVAVGFGFNERRLRKTHIARKSDYIKELEKRVNPKRITSGLTDKGNTNPED